MATNAEKTRIFVDEANGIGISTRDLMQVLGYYKRDKNGKRNLGMIIKNAEINPMARCKPFRWKDANFESAEKRAEIRGQKAAGLNDGAPNNGFGPTPTIGVANNGISHGVYEYKRPRGVTDEYTEWFRAEDFDGYWKDAVTPIHVQFGKLLVDSNSAVSILFHNSSNGWNEKECLRVDEMLDSYSMNEPLALLIVGNDNAWLLPSTVTPKDVADGKINTVIITYGTDAASLQGSQTGTHGAYLLDIDYAELGKEYEMAIVTSHTAAPSINPQTGLRTPLPANGDFGSLEFTYGCDRTRMPMSWLQSLKGLTYTWVANNWGYLKQRANPDANIFKGAYELMGVDSLLTIHTPAEWHRTSVTVNVTITVIGSQVYTQSHDFVGANANFDDTIFTSEIISGGIRKPIPNGTFSENVLRESNIYNYLFCIPKALNMTEATVRITVELQAKIDNTVVERIPVVEKMYNLNIP